MHLRHPRARLALAAALLTAAALAGAAPAGAATRIRVVDYNVDQNRSAVKRALNQIAAKPYVVGGTLQEVCKTDYDKLIATKAAWTSHFAVSKATPKQCRVAGDPVGTVAIATQPGAGKSADPIHADGDRTPTLTCVHPKGPVAAICSVHLAVKTKTVSAAQTKVIRKKQTWDIKGLAERWIGSGAVIIGGDFNAEPNEDALDNLYAGPGRGSFIAEHQLLGQPRSNALEPSVPAHKNKDGKLQPARKIDYVFFSQQHMKVPAKVNAVRLKKMGMSPHAMLIVTAVLKG